MKFFFDLDGTLLDSKPRLYHLFQELVPQSTLTFEQYWEFKLNKISHKQLLALRYNYSEEEFKVFEEIWMNKIELPEWLMLDKPFVGVVDFLKELKNNHQLYLVTARQFKEVLKIQLKEAGLLDIFDDIFVTCQNVEKYDLIKNSVVTCADDYMVGDTGKDIETGKRLGMKTVGVLSGFLNEEKLASYLPDIIVDNVTRLTFNNK